MIFERLTTDALIVIAYAFIAADEAPPVDLLAILADRGIDVTDFS